MAETLARRAVSTKGMMHYHVRDYLGKTTNNNGDAVKTVKCTIPNELPSSKTIGSEKGNNRKVITADLPIKEPMPKPRLFLAACKRAKEKFINAGTENCVPSECVRCDCSVFEKCKREWIKEETMSGPASKEKRISVAKHRRRVSVVAIKNQDYLTESQLVTAEVLRGVTAEAYKLFTAEGVLICEGIDEIEGYIQYMTK